jgi:hypothetical protein
MDIKSELDFPAVRSKIKEWRQRFPMFAHDVKKIEDIIEEHIKNHSIAMVYYRQTKKKNYLEQANKELEAVANTVKIAEKMELMSLLSQ